MNYTPGGYLKGGGGGRVPLFLGGIKNFYVYRGGITSCEEGGGGGGGGGGKGGGGGGGGGVRLPFRWQIIRNIIGNCKI